MQDDFTEKKHSEFTIKGAVVPDPSAPNEGAVTANYYRKRII